MRITKDPDLRREDILNAAVELFREEGFEKTSVDSIAKKAGISKGSFYNYFKSKEGVYEAVISGMSEQSLEVTREILTEKEVSPKERLVRYINLSFRMNEQQEKSVSRILEPKANVYQRQMYLHALDDGISKMLPVFEQLLKEGVTSKEFEILGARFSAVVMLGAFRSIHVSFYDNLEIDMETAKSYLYDFMSRLLRTKF